MHAPTPLQILTRATYLIVIVIAVIIASGFVKKKQRVAAIVAELKSVSTESSFFRQFYAEDARKTMVRSIGLIAEATTLGMAPDATINRALGIKESFYGVDEKKDELPARDAIIRESLQGNFNNFLKLGYSADARTVQALKRGELPPIPIGPHAGKRPDLVPLIQPSVSPGMEKVLANLELRPPLADGIQPTDVEIAAAKRLAYRLYEAGIIEEPVKDRIVNAYKKTADNPK